jgi:hypothetical protein
MLQVLELEFEASEREKSCFACGENKWMTLIVNAENLKLSDLEIYQLNRLLL